jgi:hypothetical protein
MMHYLRIETMSINELNCALRATFNVKEAEKTLTISKP